MSDRYKGYVNTQYTFWCGGNAKRQCVEWSQYSGPRSLATKDAKRAGWRLTREFGWQCPDCRKE